MVQWVLFRVRQRLIRSRAEGYSFVEIVIVTAVIAILASAIMPLAKVTSQRQREAELRRDLREIRTAIDKFKDAFDQKAIVATELPQGSEGYPPTLDTLVEGVEGVPVGKDTKGRLVKFLRRVPIDPMTRSTQWGLRSYQDAPDSTVWGGQNVFDVYTNYDGVALDGTRYRDW